MDQTRNDEERIWPMEAQELLVRIIVAVGCIYVGQEFFTTGCGVNLLMASGHDYDVKHVFNGRLQLMKNEDNFNTVIHKLARWKKIILPKFLFRFRQFIGDGEYVNLARGKDKKKADTLRDSAAMATNDPAETAFGVMANQHITQQLLVTTAAKSVAIRNKTFSEGVSTEFYDHAN